MSTITNNKLTDERPEDEGLELLITIRREIAERHASEGRMEQCAVHTLILNALLELQERRKADSAEPIGWTDAEELRSVEKDGCGYLFKANPITPNADPRRVIKLYAAPSSSVTGIYDDVLNIIGLLEKNEWGEHCTSTVLGSLLESEITRLVSKEQPVSVDKEFIPKNLDKALGVVGVALPESKEEFNFQTERWIQRLIDRVIRYADEFKEQPVPVVPDEWTIQDAVKFCRETGRQDAGSAMEAWNACRSAMLNGGKS